MAKPDDGDWIVTTYLVGGHVLGFLASLAIFIGAWWYCAAEYGFLFGFGLGWLPAAISAAIAYPIVRFCWPFIAVAAAWVMLR